MRTRRWTGRGAGRGLPERAWSSSTGTPWRPVTSARPRGWSIGEPGVHIGPHNVARAERGVALERTATARAVEDRNQEFKSVRADVREMEGSLERVRARIAEVARKLAVYVRARLEHSRGAERTRSRRTRSGVEPLMANALDRVKAAEAKYAAMGETAEKQESTLKNFKGTADLCYAAMRELHREIKKDQKDQRWAFCWLVLVVGTVAFTMAFLGNFLREGAVRSAGLHQSSQGRHVRDPVR